MNPDVLHYAEFAVLWDAFAPETPYGRQAKAALEPITEACQLARLHDGIEVAQALLQRLPPLALNRVTHHLKRLPRFPEEAREVYDEVELFAVKKFLHNALELVALLDEATREAFGLAPEGADLLARLDQGRQSAESFYVADAYDPELAEVRAALRTLDARMQALLAAQDAAVQAELGYGFAGRDFLLVARTEVTEALQALVEADPYDETQILVRPRRTAEAFALQSERTALLERERLREGVVIETLSAELRQALPGLLRLKEALTAFDLALARARMARELHLVRPTFGDGPIRIEQGRLLSCEALCARLQVPYTPLTVAFEAPAVVIFGSNMGGKTVVLKTVASLQLAAQLGLYVPASAFHTRLFRAFHYIGEGARREEAQGLSGFGFEIRQLTEAWSALSEGALLLFDEFARTTSSREAEALISAMLERLATEPASLALFSTHFRGVRRLTGVHYRRMSGLRRAVLDFGAAEGADLHHRISLIDRAMDYRLVEDDGSESVSDAIAIATLLGLDATVTRRAEHFFSNP